MEKTCEIAVCDRPADSLGLCHAHYVRKRKGIPLDSPIRGPVPETCTWKNCDRPYDSGGLCAGHRSRKAKGHDMDAPFRRKPGTWGPYYPTPGGYMMRYRTIAGKQQREFEHRRVMADSLGRELLPSETVHHISGNRADNRIENLQLRQGQHGAGVKMVCHDCGSHNVSSAVLD